MWSHLMTMPRRFFWTTFGTGVVAIVTILALLIWFASQTDRSVREETTQRVATSLALQIDNIATVSTDYAHWTAAWEWYVAGDDDALYDNLGSGAADGDAFDKLVFLAPDGTPSHTYVPDTYDSDLSAFVPELRDALLPAMMAAPLVPYAMTAGLALIEGEIALVAGGRIQPDDISALGPGDLPYLIGVIWLDPDRLGAMLALPDMALAPPDAAVPAGRTAMTLTGIDGVPLGQLTWPEPRPGLNLLTRTAPVVALLSLVLLGSSWMVAQMAMTQAQAHMHEWLSARSDPVTGLLNRAGLDEVIATQPVQQAMAQGAVAAIYVDLNGVKVLNDTFGHKVGDAAIEAAAMRLQSAVRADDFVARVGGDEFVCLILDPEPLAAASAVAARFNRLNEAPLPRTGGSHRTSAALGIAIATPGLTWETLIGQADCAMYEAKRRKSKDPSVFREQLCAAS